MIVLLAWGPISQGVSGQDDPPPSADEPQQRVIIEINSAEKQRGYVEEEAEDYIVISYDDTLYSYLKGRIHSITRLHDPRENQVGLVILRDGAIREGVLIEDGWEHAVLDIQGVRTKFPRATIDRVILKPTLQEMYQELRESISSDDYPRRVDMCQWLFDNRLYELAERELALLIRDKPEFKPARELMRIVQAQLILEMRAEQRAESLEGAGKEDDEETGPVPLAAQLPDDIISREDANLIRVYEIDFENPPRVSISPDVIREILQKYGAHPAIPASSVERTAMFRWEPIEIARLILEELQARELYGKVDVLSEPYALNVFRQRVHNSWLMNNCATSRCHGGLKAGELFLHQRNHKDDRVRFTNFLILERTEVNEDWPLINYDQPTMSLIIQYGLPRTQARLPHPDVPGWSHVFTQGNRRLLEDAIHWIESMYQPRPDYPVEYDPPDLAKLRGATENPRENPRENPSENRDR